MVDLKYCLVYLIKIFFVLILISSTAGWSKGFTSNKFPTITVSIIKKENNSPSVSSSIFLILNSLKGMPF